MQQATLGFLIKRDGREKICKILLAMKKRGFGKDRWNGTGGKPKTDETLRQCIVRETQEEIGITLIKPKKIGLVNFRFKFTPEFNQNVHFYLCESWQGKLIESEEMKPRWFSIENIPYAKMWPDDKFWMPLALKDKKIIGRVLFGKDDEIIKNSIRAGSE